LKTIGVYEVLGLLGKGGMSKVYKVRHPATGEVQALKLLCPHPHLASLLSEEEIRSRFTAEARVMREIEDPHVVGILDAGQHEDRPFIVMEYFCHNLGAVIGETYRIENPSRILRVDKAVRFARQTLMGLSCLHRHGIVHLDIKPFNLLLTGDETVRITDFGLSKLRGEAFTGPRQLVVGSPYYAAPEQEAHPDEADHRADLYSVGVILYRMLTGWLPMDMAISPSDRNSELDPEWDSFLLKCLDMDRERRYPTTDLMLRFLDALAIHWKNKMLNSCTHWVESASRTSAMDTPLHVLRQVPAKIAPHAARDFFNLDELWRPRRFILNDFVDNGDGTVSHKATGLRWQKAGSERTMTWEEAHGYVGQLNRDCYAGDSHWRLPTVEELMSLLIPVPHPDDYCIEPIFGRDRKWLWSADRRSFSAAWHVSVHMGYVSWQDFTCRFFARAVSSE
jgi:serine/threonine protein kinase